MSAVPDPPARVCVDASVVVKWLGDEVGSPEALKLLDHWDAQGTEIVAPGLLAYEVCNALHRWRLSGQADAEAAGAALDAFWNLPIRLEHEPELLNEALRLAGSLVGIPAVYDASYVAVAAMLDCPLWTADRRLAARVPPGLVEIRLLGATG